MPPRRHTPTQHRARRRAARRAIFIAMQGIDLLGQYWKSGVRTGSTGPPLGGGTSQHQANRSQPAGRFARDDCCTGRTPSPERLRMDFLVDMTTHVPPGTSPEAVDDIRARESVRARELATEGHLLRLWRPSPAPGPWRTDVVTPLSVHPNDPGHGSAASEFLATLTVTVFPGTSADEIDDRKTREAIRTWELAEEGRLIRLWRPPAQPGRWR